LGISDLKMTHSVIFIVDLCASEWQACHINIDYVFIYLFFCNGLVRWMDR